MIVKGVVVIKVHDIFHGQYLSHPELGLFALFKMILYFERLGDTFKAFNL